MGKVFDGQLAVLDAMAREYADRELVVIENRQIQAEILAKAIKLAPHQPGDMLQEEGKERVMVVDSLQPHCIRNGQLDYSLLVREVCVNGLLSGKAYKIKYGKVLKRLGRTYVQPTPVNEERAAWDDE